MHLGFLLGPEECLFPRTRIKAEKAAVWTRPRHTVSWSLPVKPWHHLSLSDFREKKTKQTARKPLLHIKLVPSECLVYEYNDYAILNIADFYYQEFYVFMFPLLPFFLCIRVACTFSTYSTFSQEVSRFFSLDFVKQRSLAGELVSSCLLVRRLTDH